MGHTVILVPANLRRHERIDSRFAQNLRQGPAIAKDIRQPQILALYAELFAEVLGSIQNLSY
ncbi:hypothetical protein D3C73_1108550 [compost metagenome]